MGRGRGGVQWGRYCLLLLALHLQFWPDDFFLAAVASFLFLSLVRFGFWYCPHCEYVCVCVCVRGSCNYVCVYFDYCFWLNICIK